ncbi:hypothetical protein COOONC_08326 [Cooperia oncophora]
MESLSCSICGKFMSAFDNYVRHLRRNHGDIGAQTASALVKEKKEARMALKQYQCDLCNFRGSSKDAVRMHKARNHRQALAPLTNLNADATSQKQGLACPQCLANTRDTRSLIEHARLEHEFQGDIVTQVFDNHADFKIWKEMHERLTVTSWSCYATSARNGYKIKVLQVPPTVENEAVGQSKLSIVTSTLDILLVVLYYPCLIAIGEKSVSCSRKKFSVPSVTRAIRMDHSSPSERLYWVTSTDVRNVLATMELERGKFHDNDLRSIAIRFMNNNPEDGLRLFQEPTSPDGSGFCLIVITPLQLTMLKKYGTSGVSLDDTHNPCRYNLKLLTMMIVDSVGRGVPVAYMLSANMDKEAVSKFFSVVKNLYPDFGPEYFMTDNCNTFWNAFVETFPEASRRTKRLLCSWHIQCAVFDKFAWLFPQKSPRNKELHATLLSLFTVSNKPEWHRCLSYLYKRLRELQSNGEESVKEAAATFEQYLSSNYIPKKEAWAPYARCSSIMNTNMFNERFHRSLKYTYLNKTSNSRLDALLQAMLDIVSDTVRSHEIMDTRDLMEGKFRQKENLKRHRLAVENGMYYAIVRTGKSSWKLKSTSGRIYCIKTTSCPCKNGCEQHCLLCGVCPFAVFCSCADNIKAGTSCKHSHSFQLLHDEHDIITDCWDRVDDKPCFDDDPDAPAAENSSDSDLNNNQVDRVEANSCAPDNRREFCMDIRIRTERMFDFLSAYIGKLAMKGDNEAEIALVQVERSIRTVIENRTELRIAKKKHGIPPLIAEDIEYDDELDLCAICDKREPVSSVDTLEAPIDWLQCDNCLTWVHLQCISTRDCTCCGAGFLEIAHYRGSDSNLDATLIKWEGRTLIASRRPRNASTDFSAFEKENIVSQIEKVCSDKQRLVKRSRVKKSDIERIGGNPEAEEDEEIYDDDDFYQVLLKELISKKSSNTEDPVAMTRHYIEMQKLKSKRARKKEIDNRASKDRKSNTFQFLNW